MKFPSCPKHFLSYFHASSLKRHYVLPRWQTSRGTGKQQGWFLQGTVPGKCGNLLLPLTPDALPGINDKLCTGTWCRLRYRAQVKKTYVCMYVNTQIIKTPQPRARSCKYFLLSRQSERLTAVKKNLQYRRWSHMAIIPILWGLTDRGLDSIDKIEAISFTKLLFKRWCLLLTRISISAKTYFQLEWEKTKVTFVTTLTYVSISVHMWVLHYNELF